MGCAEYREPKTAGRSCSVDDPQGRSTWKDHAVVRPGRQLGDRAESKGAMDVSPPSALYRPAAPPQRVRDDDRCDQGSRRPVSKSRSQRFPHPLVLYPMSHPISSTAASSVTPLPLERSTLIENTPDLTGTKFYRISCRNANYAVFWALLGAEDPLFKPENLPDFGCSDPAKRDAGLQYALHYLQDSE